MYLVPNTGSGGIITFQILKTAYLVYQILKVFIGDLKKDQYLHLILICNCIKPKILL